MSDSERVLVRYVDVGDPRTRAAELTAHESMAVDEINRQVAARPSLEAVIDFVFESTRDISPCDRFGLALVEDNGARLVAYHTKAAYEPVLLRKGYAEDLLHTSLAEVLRRRAVRVITDLERYLEAHPGSASTKLLVREGVRSSMTCPLIVEDRVVGVLFRSSRRPHAYDDRHVLLHQIIAERLSQAVEKTIQIERLDAALRDYFGMLAFVTHELKSPIASLMTDASLMKDGYLGELTSPQRDRLDRMISKGRYLLNLIQEYLDLARIEGRQVDIAVREVDLLEVLINPAVEIIAPQMEARRITMHREIPEPPQTVTLDPELIKIVLVNLLGNACKYGKDGGTVRLRVSRPAGALAVSVWNEGPGFPESARARLFRKFSRIQSPELLKQKGTGIGLYTCWRIIHAHGGRMEAKSQEGSWAEFSFEIPQPPIPPAA
ncbi:MAG TPA: GAF domain-containing sensor histidine kinase [Phycisphaerae bacterium]|nr:GAF domain-containing sensor histidine kinase [Phycisphaerae bacterium]HNU44248.1 GAF domain-containing sensor histidine kinase [Phycisphaerae bacterium]